MSRPTTSLCSTLLHTTTQEIVSICGHLAGTHTGMISKGLWQASTQGEYYFSSAVFVHRSVSGCTEAHRLGSQCCPLVVNRTTNPTHQRHDGLENRLAPAACPAESQASVTLVLVSQRCLLNSIRVLQEAILASCSSCHNSALEDSSLNNPPRAREQHVQSNRAPRESLHLSTLCTLPW